MTSAYPTPIEELIPQAQQWAQELGRTPSRNQIMTRFHVGAGKANTILAALTATDPDPITPPDTAPQSGTGWRLHSVPDTTTSDTDPDPSPDPLPPVADPHGAPDSGPTPPPSTTVVAERESAPVTTATDPGTPGAAGGGRLAGVWVERMHRVPLLAAELDRRVRSWPVILLAAPAFVAIWSGWVGLGALTGFGPVHPLPGIAGGFTLNSAITLPIGVETYAAYALRIWLAGTGTERARRFAKWSAIGSLLLGALGQVAYHLMTAQHLTAAPWPITTAVACLPVLVLGFGAALAHLQRHTTPEEVA